MKISKRLDHTHLLFVKRTVAAQTHFWTCLFAIAGLLILLPYTDNLDPIHYWGTLVFGVSGILVFAVSAFYHFVHDGFQITPRLEAFMEKLDQWAIFLFIAGTYTPFFLNALKSPWKEILMVTVWSMAFAGIIYSLIKHKLPKWAQSRFINTFLFVFMGWTLLVRISEIWGNLSPRAAFCFLAGSLTYTVGAIVYTTQLPRFRFRFFGFHELWHILVTIGFVFHFAMVSSFYR